MKSRFFISIVNDDEAPKNNVKRKMLERNIKVIIW